MTHTLTDAQSLTIADALTHTLTASDSRQRRIGDALFFRNPIRTERSGGRMGLLSPHTLSALRRCATTPATGASEMRYSLETPSVRSAAEDAWGYCRHTLSRRFGDALLLQRQSMTARAVSPSVNPRQRRGHTHRRRCAAERRRWHSPASPRPGGGGGIIEKILCESKYCCNFVVMKSVCAPWSAIKRERRANRRQYPLL